MLLCLELKKIRKPVLITLFGMTILACILTCTLYRDYQVCFVLDPWEIGTEYFGLLFPLLVTVPICWQLYYERRNHFLIYTLPRISKKRYMGAKWLAYALAAFLIVFIPYFLSALCSIYIANPSLQPPSEKYVHIFHSFFKEAPLVYSLLLSLWKGILGVLVMTFGFVLALYSENLFIVLTAPFVYVVLENFGWAILGIPKYRLITAFEPSSLSSAVVSGASFVVGPLLLCIVIGITVLYYSKVKHYAVYEM
nr:hypothetical protein [uncultured Oscillibacter sp.]